MYTLPSNIWHFSASSQEKLQSCLSAAKYDSQNKWIQKFKIKPPVSSQEDEEHVTEEIFAVVEDPSNMKGTEDVRESEEYVDFIREVLDVDPLTHFHVMIDMCLKDKVIYNLLMYNLSISSVEKICNNVFITRDLNPEFLKSFYELFLSEFLKKEHTWLSLDLLVKAKESHGVHFKMLLVILLNKKEFPSNILQEFVTTLDASDLTTFLNNIIINDISNEMFIHNIYTIFLAYKDCHKNENIHSYILKKLTQTAHMCTNDKNYGRFLLTFIQNQKCVSNLTFIENIVEIHRSAFKRLCINALNTLKQL